MGKIEFGLYALVSQTLSFLSLSDLGISSTVLRFIARYRGENKHEKISSLLSTVMLISIITSILILIIVFIFSSNISTFLGVSVQYYPITRLIFIILGIALVFQFPCRIGMGIMAGYQLYGPHYTSKIVNVVLNSLLVLFLNIFNSLNLINLVLISAIDMVFSELTSIFVAWKLTGPWNLSLSKITVHMFKEIFGYSTSAFLNTLSNLLYDRGLGISTGKLLSLGACGVFSIAQSVLTNAISLIQSFSGPMISLASEWQASNNITKLKRVNLYLIKMTFIISLVFTSTMIFYSEQILKLLLNKSNWSGDDFKMIYYAIVIMSIGISFGLPQLVSRSTLQAVGKYWQVSLGGIFSSITALSIGIFMLHYQSTIIYAGVGWSLYYLIQGVLVYPLMLLRYFNISLLKLIKETYLIGVIIFVFSMVIGLILKYCININILSKFILSLFLFCFLNFTIVLLSSGQSKNIFLKLKRFKENLITNNKQRESIM